MARNEEKAQNMMNRWVAAQVDATRRDRGVRPYLSSVCDDLGDCEYWRRDIIREVTALVRDIQNAGLGEHTLRDMNDTINKKIREKGHWERRIRELGGPNYLKSRTTFEGKSVAGGQGYMYFGATKNLPGVRELFEQPEIKKKKRTRHAMYKGIDPDYYGYRDEDDGVLVLCEMEAENKAVQEAVDAWKAEKRQKQEAREKGEDAVKDDDSGSAEESESDSAVDGELSNPTGEPKILKAHVTVPSQNDIETLILKQKKEAALAKFAVQEDEKSDEDNQATKLPMIS